MNPTEIKPLERNRVTPESFFDSPMLLEAKRFFRKFFGFSRFQKFHMGTLIFVGIAYLFLILVAIAYRQAITSDYVIHFQTFLLCFIVPTLTYGAVAGERERRTWDLLMIAPIRKSQIIIGKFVCAALVVVGVVVQLLPLVLICAFSNKETVMNVLTNEVTSVGFGCAVAALGIFLSSLVNRGFTAQVAIYAVLFLWLLLMPMVLSALYETREFDLWINPFSSIAVHHTLYDPGVADQWERSPSLGYSFSIQFLMYAVMTGTFLLLSIARISNQSERRLSSA